MGHPAVELFVSELAARPWVRNVWLYGSLATGDHRPGASDIDIVAVTDHALGSDDLTEIRALHRRIDKGPGHGSALGCAYVGADLLTAPSAQHPTWTHGALVHRRLSAMVRAELHTHGQALLGLEPRAVLEPMTDHDLKTAARGELAGYWTWAVRRPWLFLDPAFGDLALITMARARHTCATGTLLTKTDALDRTRAPAVVVAGVRRRRESGQRGTLWAPRLAHHAWHDTRRTIAEHVRLGQTPA